MPEKLIISRFKIRRRGCCLAVLFFILMLANTFAQDQVFARKVIKRLSSPKMHGRGYVKRGDKKAAFFLRDQFQKLGLKPLGENYFQTYSFSINSYPAQLKVKIDKKTLVPGKEYVIWPSANTMNKTFELVNFINDSVIDSNNLDLKNKLLVVDSKHSALKKKNTYKSSGVIFINPGKPIWNASHGRKLSDYLVIDLQKKAWENSAKELKVKVKNKFFDKYQTQNVVGFIPGNGSSDSLIVLTAHYDHLGRMGRKTYFPGANDNASGVAMILDLARYFSTGEKKLDQNLVIIALSGEEAGLMGANYFADYPLIDLKKIKVLINLDMVGTGSDGITVVNAKQLPRIYNRLNAINNSNNYLKQLKIRGESCNSDHCPFYLKGVPAIFIYTMGTEYTQYHNPDDKETAIPLTEYNDLFSLLRDFIQID